jgi:hypothetical protein
VIVNKFLLMGLRVSRTRKHDGQDSTTASGTGSVTLSPCISAYMPILFWPMAGVWTKNCDVVRRLWAIRRPTHARNGPTKRTTRGGLIFLESSIKHLVLSFTARVNLPTIFFSSR